MRGGPATAKVTGVEDIVLKKGCSVDQFERRGCQDCARSCLPRGTEEQQSTRAAAPCGCVDADLMHGSGQIGELALKLGVDR